MSPEEREAELAKTPIPKRAEYERDVTARGLESGYVVESVKHMRSCCPLTSPLVVEFRVDPQCRAAMWLRWSSVRSAKVELQNFNLESAGGRDDRREISAGRATGEGW